MKNIILELIASRICHDLISPTSAIQNGLEFIEEMGIEDAGDEAMGLIADSIKTSSARLQVFRVAYGLGGNDPSVKPEDVHRVFGNLLQAEGKTTQNWDPYGPIGFDERPASYAKVLMNTLILAHECLPKGGEITVSADENNNCVILAKGENANIRPFVLDALSHDIEVEELDPRTVHAYAATLLANEHGFTISMAPAGDSQIKLEISTS